MRAPTALALALAGLLGSGCRCQRDTDDVLAHLEDKRGSVERDYAEKLEAWTTAELKTAFSTGDGVRTTAHAEASLRLADESKLKRLLKARAEAAAFQLGKQGVLIDEAAAGGVDDNAAGRELGEQCRRDAAGRLRRQAGVDDDGLGLGE